MQIEEAIACKLDWATKDYPKYRKNRKQKHSKALFKKYFNDKFRQTTNMSLYEEIFWQAYSLQLMMAEVLEALLPKKETPKVKDGKSKATPKKH
jgi:hypothetical protein